MFRTRLIATDEALVGLSAPFVSPVWGSVKAVKSGCRQTLFVVPNFAKPAALGHVSLSDDVDARGLAGRAVEENLSTTGLVSTV